MTDQSANPNEKEDPIKLVRDNQTLPTFDKVTVKNKKQSSMSGGIKVLTNTDNPDKPLPEIEVFLHHNFNMMPSATDNGGNKGETMYSLRTSFDTDLEGHPLWKNISSIIVYSGYWKIHTASGVVVILGPGQYNEVRDDGIDNDSIIKFESTII